jgi:hypothetical protein
MVEEYSTRGNSADAENTRLIQKAKRSPPSGKGTGVFVVLDLGSTDQREFDETQIVKTAGGKKIRCF